MTKIKLQSICLQNFKGTRYLLLNLDGKNTNISGANGSGKTTVYKAYYWCLTGKTLEPNETVQTLDENNEVIHKIETVVTVTLLVDDSYEVSLQRKLKEDWKALGQPDEQLKGTKQERFWNDVPLNVGEFNAKLNSICDFEKWMLLSDITKFMELKTDERRKLLLSIAGEVNETELMRPYPELLKAVAEKKTIDELKIQSLSTKKRSNEELQTIPSQISAQDMLKSNEDFVALKDEKKQLDAQISDLDKLMQGSTEELQVVKDYNTKVAEAEKAVENYKREWNTKHNTEVAENQKKVGEAQVALFNTRTVANKHKLDNDERIKQKAVLQEKFAALHEEWDKENGTEFSFTDNDACPYCGHKFTEDEKEGHRSKAVAEFNKRKAERLTEIQGKAELVNEQITVLTGSINEYNKITQPQDKNAVSVQETALNEAQKLYEAIVATTIVNDASFAALEKVLEGTVQNKPVIEHDQKSEENEAKKRELWAKRDELIQKIAGENTNKRIEEEKIRLGKRSQELAQIIADCDKKLWEISEYRKAKVDAVESKVNSFFNLARWKFYVKNVSNDDMQEVCICHHNGVDYNSTNGADKINLGVDIIAGLSKACGIEAPLFVDNAESVADIIKTETQLITLEHVKHAPFETTHF